MSSYGTNGTEQKKGGILMEGLFFDVPRTPPLVAYRRQLSDDPTGPWDPAAEWLSAGWESRSYPVLDIIESMEQWLSNEIRFFAAISGHPENDPMRSESDISHIVRDAYRLVRHLRKTRGWKKAPAEPQGTFLSDNAGCRALAGELAKVRDWIRGKAAGVRASKITVEEANHTAYALAKQDPSFIKGGARQWAEPIRDAAGKTCSVSTVEKTALWQTTMGKTGRARPGRKPPKTVRPTTTWMSRANFFSRFAA